ncbi:hypothetical protein SAY87_009999 [Trapa incisa]|uniref:DUF7036 domain-containing protein n=1 Tax=Trapa incisa TaxID=236973 RepID=A0AAN7GPW3_9MYRT|nr:hypothetical protein SAY87_009999 [Trapa incisa]
MGKGSAEEGQELPQTHHSVSVSSEPGRNSQIRCGCGCVVRHVELKCVVLLVLSVAGFLSAAFWLPPFSNLGDQHDLHLDRRFKGHDIVASFYVAKPVSFLKDNIMQLKDDISGEMNAPDIKVVFLFLEPLPGQNVSKVFFAVDPDEDSPGISIAAQSLIRASFTYLVSHQLSLRLTTSLFGDPFSFEVMKFRGGITITPTQSAYLLQKVQIYFNFTLNYSIEQVQGSFYELKSQLKSGLHLSPYENLYISLSNLKGSTVDAPTIVQSSVLLAIGTQPSKPRLKQLAQTIRGNSHSTNLGLNNTTFGKVKQVRLSSILQHSLNGGDGVGGPSPSPSPMPYTHPHRPHRHHHHHHHHRHHHHHTHHHPTLGPTMPPTPTTEGGHTPTWTRTLPAPPPREKHSHLHSPSPSIIYEAKPPQSHLPAPSILNKAKPPSSGYGQKQSPGQAPEQSHVTPTSSPAPKKSMAPLPQQKHKPTLPPSSLNSARGPSPHSASGQVQLPSKNQSGPALAISSSSSSCAYTIMTKWFPLRWAIMLLTMLILHI